MISFICGKVFEKDHERITLICGNIGLELRVPPAMIRKLKVDQEVCVHVSMIVRQESLQLYGFETKEERKFFEKLQHINNIGPKLAFNLISSLGVQGIVDSLRNNNAAALASVPGIGKKTATRILVELKGAFGEEGFETISGKSDEVDHAIKALVKLGYSKREALSAVKSVPINDASSAEDILKQALRKLSKAGET